MMTAGDGKGDRSPATIRKEARLQDLLEAVSDLGPPVNGQPGETTRVLHADGGTVTLTQEDFDLLQQYTEKTAWNPQVSRDVCDLWDWLSTCEKRE
jgi:hypothetical protein